MSDPSSDNEATRWSRVGRRWAIMLVVALGLNFTLIVLAFCSYEQSGAVAPPSQIEFSANTNRSSIEAPDTASRASAAPAQVAVHESSTTEIASAPTIVPDPVVVAHVEARNLDPRIGDPAPDASNIDRPAAREPLAAAELTIAAEPPADRQPTKSAQLPSAAAEVAAEAVATHNTPIASVAPSTRPGLQSSLVIINPPTTGGVVHFLIDGAVISLLPAEYHRLEGARDRRIAFHRGDEWDDCERVIREGVYVFDIGDVGWELTQPSSEVTSRLLSVCRAIATKNP